MDTAERLQQRIGSLRELGGIVRTMKTLSAVSIHQYEEATLALAGYYRTVELGLHVVLRRHALPEPRRRRPAPGLGAVVFGSDHGLCGRFNEEIAAHTLRHLEAVAGAADHRHLLAVGARVAASLEQAGQAVEADVLVPGSAEGITATVQQILLKIDEWREQADVRRVVVFYNHHGPGAGYRPTTVEMLPVSLERFHRLEAEPWPSRVLPTFSMEASRLLSALLREYFFVTLFRACAESQASEHGARLAAMQAAQRNLEEHLDELTAEYRRQRQAAITTELLDVVTGFEALSGEG